MKRIFNIYCDESCHIYNKDSNTMALGAIWCPDDKKKEIFERLRDIKERHGLSRNFEIKWNKISPAKIDFYMDLLNYFFDCSDLHFRVLIVPDKSTLNHDKYNQTPDGFYYKMYFNLLKNIFDPTSGYNVYLDIKDTQGQSKVDKLHEVLCNSHYDYSNTIIKKVQQVRSHEVELIALSDFFTGAITYLWRELKTSNAKLEIIDKIRNRSGYSLKSSTLQKESKFNIFVWKSEYEK